MLLLRRKATQSGFVSPVRRMKKMSRDPHSTALDTASRQPKPRFGQKELAASLVAFAAQVADSPPVLNLAHGYDILGRLHVAAEFAVDGHRTALVTAADSVESVLGILCLVQHCGYEHLAGGGGPCTPVQESKQLFEVASTISGECANSA